MIKPNFKSLEWSNLMLLAGLACVLGSVYMLVGEAWALLLFGVLLIIAATVADAQAPPR